MEAIYAGPHGDAWKKSRVQIYGWEDFSWNLSTSTNTSRGPNANFPLIYDLRPNRFEQNQFVLYIERVPDELQTDHIDWGFRISGVYGLDYRFMISRGLFSDQLLKDNIDDVGNIFKRTRGFPTRFFHCSLSIFSPCLDRGVIPDQKHVSATNRTGVVTKQLRWDRIVPSGPGDVFEQGDRHVRQRHKVSEPLKGLEQCQKTTRR